MSTPVSKRAPSHAAATAPNLLNLPASMAVPKLTKPATYRLLNAGRKTQFADRPTSPALFQLRADCHCLDPLTGTAVEVRVAGRKQRIGETSEFLEPIFEYDFDRAGYMLVQPLDQKMFEFMERTSMNAGNPFRDPSVSAYFERVDHEAAAEKAMAYDDLVDEARQALRDMEPDVKVRLAAALNLCQLTDPTAVAVQALRGFIKTSPQAFIEQAGSKTLQTRAEVLQALDEKVLLFNDNARQFQWGDSKGEILNVPVGVDGVGHLVTFLIGDDKRGAAVYTELAKRLDKINNG